MPSINPSNIFRNVFTIAIRITNQQFFRKRLAALLSRLPMALTNGGNTSIVPDELAPILYVGHHETQRNIAVTGDLVGNALDSGFDMITVPITTSHFQSRVLSILQAHVDQSTSSNPHIASPPLITPLMPIDTDLTPELGHLSLVAATSAWIDLASPDPLIANISRQVFSLEIAYAAFCGVNSIVVFGPTPEGNALQFARAIIEALSIGPYLQLSIVLPMHGEAEINVDGHLAELARPEYLDQTLPDEEPPLNLFSSWDVWNTIRSACNYNTRLTVGTSSMIVGH